MGDLSEPLIVVEDHEIAAVFSPYVKERLTANDERWRAIVRKKSKKSRRARVKRQLFGWIPQMRRDQKDVYNTYETQWGARTAVDILKKPKSLSAISWRENCHVLANYLGLKRCYLLFLMRAIETLSPKRVLEVGCGAGLNLFVLAAQFPNVKFHGVELTKEGVLSALDVKRKKRLPEAIADFSPIIPRDYSAHRRVVIKQASAEDLPIGDNAFDLVFTVQALEQMEAIRSSALSEISRVAKSHLVMIEPFADWNKSEMRRNRIRGRDHFAASISDLRAFGFKPVFATHDLPSKISMGVGVVIAESEK